MQGVVGTWERIVVGVPYMPGQFTGVVESLYSSKSALVH